jgi:hypothetical protein
MSNAHIAVEDFGDFWQWQVVISTDDEDSDPGQQIQVGGREPTEDEALDASSNWIEGLRYELSQLVEGEQW